MHAASGARFGGMPRLAGASRSALLRLPIRSDFPMILQNPALLTPSASDCAARRRLTKSEDKETIIINRSGRSTYPEENSVQTSGATPELLVGPRRGGIGLDSSYKRSGHWVGLRRGRVVVSQRWTPASNGRERVFYFHADHVCDRRVCGPFLTATAMELRLCRSSHILLGGHVLGDR
jgi:hypothetical protein